MVATAESEERLHSVPPKRLLVASDFDGTLAEIVSKPSFAAALPESINAVQRLVRRVRKVAVISGRATAALRELVPVAGVLWLGDYGLGEADGEERRALTAFNAAAEKLVSALPGIRLEAKPGSSSIHFRGSQVAGSEVLAAIAPLAERHGLQARFGRMVVEVMPRRAGKEHALSRLVEELEPGGVFFAGDDSGDVGCFELVAGLRLPHLAVGVASPETDRSLFAACDLVVNGPRELAGLLSRIADWAEADPRSG